ncbi:MAG: HEAT repeat domain-containing protein [Planctomycetota bacterium]|jgi:HEAT repeat protein
MKQALVILIVAVGVGYGAFRIATKPPRVDPTVRGALELASPTESARVERLFGLFTSGEQTDLGGRRVPTWDVVGERALFDLGMPAWAYVLAPRRYPEYHRSPNIVSNILRVLPKRRIAGASPELYPFLLHFLEPANYPRGPEGADWAKGFRKPIFAIFTHYPDERAALACVDELDRKIPGEDLRNEAIMVLLRLGKVGPLHKRYDDLPGELQLYILARLYEFADRPGVHLATARTFIDRLKETRRSKVAFQRIYAAATLMRIGGEPGLPEQLLDDYRTATAEGDHDAAWTAIRMLADNGEADRVYKLCFDTATKGEVPLAREVANELLRRHFLDRPEVLAHVRKQLRDSPADKQLDLRPLLALLKADRGAAGAFVKSLLENGNAVQRSDALRFVRTKKAMPEAGPWILELARKTPDTDLRLACYQALTVLGTRAALPLMRAELDNPHANTRVAAAQAIMAMEDGQGLAKLGDLLRAGDETILDTLVFRAQGRGAAGVPSQLVHDVALAVSGLPSEESRLKALFILRCRGVLEDVRIPLMKAYRTEPSRRVAGQIETTLQELAYR